MTVSSGYPIVAQVLALTQANPDSNCLHILDEAMAAHRGSSPDFRCQHAEFGNYLRPPSPFAEILRQAFDPTVQKQDLHLMVGLDADPNTYPWIRLLEERWQKVISRFAERYQLWHYKSP